MSDTADILVLTAGYGEGHNSAARSICDALGKEGISSLCLDPCALGAPKVNEFLSSLYRAVTTHAPWLWRRVYLSTDRQDFSRGDMLLMQKPESKLRDLFLEHRPKVIVSTYPLYPYFLERIFQKGVSRVPVVTVVTDSIEINSAWRNAPTDYWIVTDQKTRESMLKEGLPPRKVLDMGFPVPPHFSDLSPVSLDDVLDPFKVLYFPTPKKPHVRRVSRELLDASPRIQLTIVLGRNFRKLYQRAKQIKDEYPGRVEIKGWTKQVPELINNHHIVVGKAGGATVHEALAAACPMLIHHLVPGQEEGNLSLLELLEGGKFIDDPSVLAQHVLKMLDADGFEWRKMKRNLEKYARPHAAQQLAVFLKNLIDQ